MIDAALDKKSRSCMMRMHDDKDKCHTVCTSIEPCAMLVMFIRVFLLPKSPLSPCMPVFHHSLSHLKFSFRRTPYNKMPFKEIILCLRYGEHGRHTRTQVKYL